MEVIRPSAIRTGRLYNPGNIPGTHFCWRMSQPQGHSAAGRIMLMKNSNDTVGNRTRVLPACSAVPQPTASPRTPLLTNVSNNDNTTACLQENLQALHSTTHSVTESRTFLTSAHKLHVMMPEEVKSRAVKARHFTNGSRTDLHRFPLFAQTTVTTPTTNPNANSPGYPRCGLTLEDGVTTILRKVGIYGRGI
jgi:hypothetical protein